MSDKNQAQAKATEKTDAKHPSHAENPRDPEFRTTEGGGVIYSVLDLMRDPRVAKSFEEADEFLKEQLERQSGSR